MNPYRTTAASPVLVGAGPKKSYVGVAGLLAAGALSRPQQRATEQSGPGHE